MSGHGSHHSSDAYGGTVISASVGMGMLRSAFPEGREPVPQVERALFDKNHCGACDASTDYSSSA
ncbi:hypothetical protein BPAE_0058g00290 [Botrytis paeoniae]|uniref:Uncharacterized protein n=1 Tax=Botrytis paeoniae TaxID=278948 RepID=A0A4Z1FT67_9HELO|nr:hypothetical protein BPAE_0058g00290 [Botrytis paeoniae]